MVVTSSTFSIRLPESLKERLDRTAKLRDMSVNALIVELLQQHYDSLGFPAGQELVTRAGRRLVIRSKDGANHAPGLPYCTFFIEDAVSTKELASYRIGCSQQFLDQFGTTRGAQYKLATELGLALLHYYNKIGIDIIRLEWDQFFEDEALRILNGNDLQTIFGVPISSLDEFVTSLRDAVWQDMFLKYKELRTLHDVNGKPRGYFAEQEVFNMIGDHIGHIYYEPGGMRLVHRLDGTYLCHIWYNMLLKHKRADQIKQQPPLKQQPPGMPVNELDIEPRLSEAPPDFLYQEVELA